MSSRIQTIAYSTQDYVSVQHKDNRIDMYVTEPARGVRPTTGLMLLIHGWGNDASVAYAEESLAYADTFDLVVTRVEYRDCGREAHHPPPGWTWDVPYDFSKVQTIDCIRAAYATLDRYPQLDRQRVYVWGGSQGGHLGAQCLVFAPHLWALAVLNCGIYLPLTHAEGETLGFGLELRPFPQHGFIDYALGQGNTYPPHEQDIRNPYRNAELMPADVPVVLIHGTMDDNVDIKHSVFMYAKLLGLGRPVRLCAIENGDHGLGGAVRDDENTRFKATLKYASDALRQARRAGAALAPAAPVRIPVRGGAFTVEYSASGPELRWAPDVR